MLKSWPNRSKAQRFRRQVIYDEALYNNANDIAANLKKLSADLSAGRGTAGKLLQSDEMYNKINRIADRVNHSMIRSIRL